MRLEYIFAYEYSLRARCISKHFGAFHTWGSMSCFQCRVTYRTPILCRLTYCTPIQCRVTYRTPILCRLTYQCVRVYVWHINAVWHIALPFLQCHVTGGTPSVAVLCRSALLQCSVAVLCCSALLQCSVAVLCCSALLQFSVAVLSHTRHTTCLPPLLLSSSPIPSLRASEWCMNGACEWCMRLTAALQRIATHCNTLQHTDAGK